MLQRVIVLWYAFTKRIIKTNGIGVQFRNNIFMSAKGDKHPLLHSCLVLKQMRKK